MLWPVSRLGPGIAGFAPLLALASVIWLGQPLPVRAASLPGELSLVSVAAARTSEPPPTSSPIPRPVSRYALDVDALGAALPNVGAFTGISTYSSADGAVSTRRFQASSAEAGTTIVESTIRALSTDDQAEEKYTDTQKEKTKEHSVHFEGVSGWQADRVSTFQTPNASGERATGALLRFRNAVVLIEIRGSAQRVSVEDAKGIMKKTLDSLREAAGDSD